MLIFHEQKIAFIHIPKNAGSSIRETLLEYEDKKTVKSIEGWRAHPLIEKQLETLPYIFNEDYFLFACVRNPYTRVLSAYLQGNTQHNLNLSFKEYLMCMMDKKYEHNDRLIHGAPQHRFIYDENNSTVDFIIRFENIERDYKELYDIKIHELGKFETIKHTNKAGSSKENLFTEEAIVLINEIYSKDFELFNYDMLEMPY